jgi:hypothetical protein
VPFHFVTGVEPSVCRISTRLEALASSLRTLRYFTLRLTLAPGVPITSVVVAVEIDVSARPIVTATGVPEASA